MEKISILNTPVQFEESDFLSLLSLSVGYAVSRQTAMGESVIADNGWNVDIKKGEISFGERVFPCGVLGSESASDGTWLWGWGRTQGGLSPAVTARSGALKRALQNCPEFTNAKFRLDELHTGHNLSMTAMAACPQNVCYYRCPHSGGALYVIIENLPDEVFKPLSLETLARQYVEVISSFYCDHRLLAAGIIHTNGFGFTEEINSGFCRIACREEDKTLCFDFENADGLWRTANVRLG